MGHLTCADRSHPGASVIPFPFFFASSHSDRVCPLPHRSPLPTVDLMTPRLEDVDVKTQETDRHGGCLPQLRLTRLVCLVSRQREDDGQTLRMDSAQIVPHLLNPVDSPQSHSRSRK